MGFTPWGVKPNRRLYKAPADPLRQESRPRRDRAARPLAAGEAEARRLLPARVALALLVFVAPHLLGGIYAWSTALLAFSSSAALALTLWAARDGEALGSDAVAVTLASALLINALHALPLPASSAAWVAPAAYAHAAKTAEGLHREVPRWIAFSLDPAGSWERILFGAAVFASYCTARMLTLRGRATPVLAVVALSTVAVALSHLGHRMVGAESVYGLYTPRFRVANGPILNMNNLAGLLALGLPVCLGLSIRHDGALRWAWLACAATISATGLLAGSRAGLVVLLVGPIVLACTFWGFQRASKGKSGSSVKGPRHASALTVAVMVLTLLAVGYGFADLAADDFLDTDYQDLSKFQMYRAEVSALLGDTRSALLGVGRGAFRVAVMPIVPEPIRMMYAECLPLQYAIEFGIPCAIVLLCVLSWQAGRAVLWWRSPAQLGGAVGVLTLGLQNLLDFSLELVGIAIPAVVCLAASMPKPARDTRDKPARWRLTHLAVAGLVVSALASVSLGQLASRHDIRVVQERLTASSHAGDSKQFWDDFSETVRFHPADATIAGLAAYEKMREGAPDAPFWLNRTMRLAPALGNPHIWAGYWLRSRGRWSQAEDELRSAGALEPQVLLSVLCAWLRDRPSSEFAINVAPTSGPGRRDVLNAAAECLEGVAGAEAEKLDAILLAESPAHPAAHLRAARRSLAANEPANAIAEVRLARKLAPRLADTFELEALALTKLGRAAQAATLLASAIGRTDNKRRLLFALASAQAAAGDGAAMRDTIDQLRVNSGANPTSLAEALAHQSQCERTLGNKARALTAMVEAYRTSNARSYQAAASLIAYDMGQTEYVLHAWAELCEAQYDGRAYCNAREKLRKQHELDGLELPR